MTETPQPTDHPPRRWLAPAALVVLSLIWGYNWVIMKQAMRYSGPFDFAALRTLLGAAALFAVMALLRRPLRPLALKVLLPLGLLQTAGFTGLSQWALVAGGAGKTAVLAYTMPFWVLVLAWPMLGERMRGGQALAVGLAAVGLTLVFEPWQRSGTVLSELLAVGSGLAWAASAVVMKRMRRDESFDLLNLTAWQMLVGAVVLCGVALALAEPGPRLDAPFVFLLAYITLAGTALGWWLWGYVLQHMRAGTASLSLLAVPVVGALASAWHLGERPNAAELAGMALILLAIGLLSMHFVRRRGGLRHPAGAKRS